MNDWDWNSIYVVGGEWWLFVIVLAALLAGLAIGYAVGRSRGYGAGWRDRAAADLPEDMGGSTRL